MLKAVVFLVMVPTAICFAQADRAAVTGTISDPAHLAMAAAHVSLVYPGTGLRRETQSSSYGVYHIGGLPIGECYLEVARLVSGQSRPSRSSSRWAKRGAWMCPWRSPPSGRP